MESPRRTAPVPHRGHCPESACGWRRWISGYRTAGSAPPRRWRRSYRSATPSRRRSSAAGSPQSCRSSGSRRRRWWRRSSSAGRNWKTTPTPDISRCFPPYSCKSGWDGPPGKIHPSDSPAPDRSGQYSRGRRRAPSSYPAAGKSPPQCRCGAWYLSASPPAYRGHRPSAPPHPASGGPAPAPWCPPAHGGRCHWTTDAPAEGAPRPSPAGGLGSVGWRAGPAGRDPWT